MTCCTKYFEDKRIFECCNDSACARVTVKPGQEGEIKIYEAPELFLFRISRIVWDKCCKNPQSFPVQNECCKDVVLASGMSVCNLPAGDYEICICDAEGNPIVPDSGEVIATFCQSPK